MSNHTAATDITYDRWAEGVTVYRVRMRPVPVGEHGLNWQYIVDDEPIAEGETVKAGEIIAIEIADDTQEQRE